MKYYVFDPMVLRKSLNPLQEVGVMKFTLSGLVSIMSES